MASAAQFRHIAAYNAQSRPKPPIPPRDDSRWASSFKFSSKSQSPTRTLGLLSFASPMFLRCTTRFRVARHPFRGLATSSPSAKVPTDVNSQQSRKPYRYQKPPLPKETWLARYLRKSPTAMSIFKGTTSALGAGNPRQVAGRRTHHIYETSCIMREEDEAEFWHKCVLFFPILLHPSVILFLMPSSAHFPFHWSTDLTNTLKSYEQHVVCPRHISRGLQ